MTYAAVRQGLCCCTLYIQTQDSPLLDEHDAFVWKALGSIVPIPFPEKANRTQITLLSIIKLTQISHLGPDHWWRGQRRAARIELRMVVTDNKEPERAIGHMIPFISSSCFATRVSVGFRPTQTYTHSSEKKKLSLRLEGHCNYNHKWLLHSRAMWHIKYDWVQLDSGRHLLEITTCEDLPEI